LSHQFISSCVHVAAEQISKDCPRASRRQLTTTTTTTDLSTHTIFHRNLPSQTITISKMDQAKELLEMPREFLNDGRGFITRCSKREL
jgi:hypothetical protein